MVQKETPELTDDELQKLSETAEDAARSYVFARIPKREVSTLEVAVEASGPKPIHVYVDINLQLSPKANVIDVQKLADEAAGSALSAAEAYLRELKCRSRT